jgi:hypothetical protein
MRQMRRNFWVIRGRQCGATHALQRRNSRVSSLLKRSYAKAWSESRRSLYLPLRRAGYRNAAGSPHCGRSR